jgi:hypothetical protein
LAGSDASPSSEIAACPLQDLDLIAVGVCDEEKAGDDAARWGEVHELAGGKPCRRQPGMFGIDIVDADGKVPVAIAQIIGLGPALVDRQFDLERGFDR